MLIVLLLDYLCSNRQAVFPVDSAAYMLLRPLHVIQWELGFREMSETDIFGSDTTVRSFFYPWPISTTFPTSIRKTNKPIYYSEKYVSFDNYF